VGLEAKDEEMKGSRLNVFLLVAALACFAACRAENLSAADIREPVAAGKFYPQSAYRLRQAIEKYLQDAVPALVKKPCALLVPHAGYIYSGQICADAFRQVRDASYEVVVILGTNHTRPGFDKISLYPGSGFRTPLGVAGVDKNIVKALLKDDPEDCVLDNAPHEDEHSVEVVVPFVQVVFPKAKIVPVVVGAPDPRLCSRFGATLAKVLKNKNALIIASSDLSHYPSASDARLVDEATLAAVATLDPAVFQRTLRKNQDRGIAELHTSACGEAPLMAAMTAAKALGAKRGVVISYANSADSLVGEASRAVGYGAVAMVADPDVPKVPSYVSPSPAIAFASLQPSDQKALLTFARETLSRLFLTDTAPLARSEKAALMQPRGAFVTLKKHGQLRGCIGHMIADEPLLKVVGAMAIQAAFNDRRFPPLTFEELKDTEIEISVLTPMRRVPSYGDITVGRDGVLLVKDGRSAVFLPQVATEQGWTRDEMLDNLCRKAGLEQGCWKTGAQFSTFQAAVFSESDFK